MSAVADGCPAGQRKVICYGAVSYTHLKYQSFQVRDNALGVVHRKEVIYPLVKGFFEEMEFPIPFDSDTYLKDQYKDYMVLPSEEKRQIHAIYIHANLNK